MAGKKYPTIKPTDFSKDRIEKILAEARGEARPVPLVSRAPPPPSPLRHGSWRPPELIRQPRELPTDYPDTLRLRTWAVIDEVREKFSQRPQLLDFCKQVLANLAPTFCTEVKAARLQGPQAFSHLDGLLDILLLYNEKTDSARDNLRQDLKRSKEWAAFIHELLRAEQQARGSPQSSDEAEATGAVHKYARFWKKGFEGLHPSQMRKTEKYLVKAGLTIAERDCYNLRVGYSKTFAEIASRKGYKHHSTAQEHYRKAKAKVEERNSPMTRNDPQR